MRSAARQAALTPQGVCLGETALSPAPPEADLRPSKGGPTAARPDVLYKKGFRGTPPETPGRGKRPSAKGGQVCTPSEGDATIRECNWGFNLRDESRSYGEAGASPAREHRRT